jgi:hypothetical protein
MPGSPTPDRPTRAGLDTAGDRARRVAIAALLHRLNGGLNNAALAFELALSRNGDDGSESADTLNRGVAGVEQASRAATLLALIIDPTMAPPPTPAGAYAQDVADILRAHARRVGCNVESAFDMSSLAPSDITPAATAAALLSGLATLDREQPAASEAKTAKS